jgi:nicotinamide riboside transporter PnuC
MKPDLLSLLLRLDYLSCILTIFSTVLVGRRYWEGWVLAAANSVIICVIGLRTSQLGFIPANLFCIVLYAINLRTWRKAEVSPADFSRCQSQAQESR